MSEAEELRQRLGMAEEEILQQRALRKTLYMLMGDLRTPGVRPPKRVAGGFSTYPRPSKRNVAKAGKYNSKAKERAVHRVYGKHCSLTFLFLLPLSNLFYCHRLVLLSSKTPK